MKISKHLFFSFLLIPYSVYSQLEEDPDKLVCFISQQATFPGGLDSLKKFIQKNLVYPHIEKNVESKEIIQFTVNEDGSISDLKIIKSLCDPCDKGVLEVFSKMPNWIPVTQNGKPVKSKIAFPIIFKL